MIEAKELSKHYGRTHALNQVSFTIAEHEVVGLLGPNGAGKTTLMKLLTGYLEPTSGTATLGGIDVVDDPYSIQRQIGYMPENAPHYPEMLVQEYLQMMADFRDIPKERQTALISDAVYKTGLEDHLVRPIGELSKGYRQRVGFAQAILHQPNVLILDEPTSGLDPNQIIEIRRLIRNLAKNATVLLSTHILSEVELTCERVLIIMNGRLQLDARLEDLRASHAAVVSVHAGGAQVELALKDIPGVKAVSRQEEHSGFTRYRVEGGNGDLCPSIYDVAHKQGWRLSELKSDQRTLETVFRELGGHSGGAL